MKRSTRWMIVIVYFSSQLLGLLAFYYDNQTRKLRTNRALSLYSGAISVLMFCSVPLLFRIQWKPRNTNGPDMHFKISALMCLIRILAVLITIILNWLKRKEFMRTITRCQFLRRNILQSYTISSKVQRYYENSIQRKFYWGFISNIIMMLISYDILGGIFDIESPMIIIGLGILCTVLNVIMTHYFFLLLNVNTLLALIKEEVKRILNQSSELFKMQRLKQIKPGVLVTSCCRLADELDDLAFNQYKLQKLGERIIHMYEAQGACIMLTIYMNNISVIYMLYMILQHEELAEGLSVIVALAIVLTITFVSYADLHFFNANMLHFDDYVREIRGLLKNRQPWLPTLDERFEKSLKDFSIQLAAFPVQMKILGLFRFNRVLQFASLGSTISNAIVLMQYDYKISRN